MRENLDITGAELDLDEASRNLIFFMVNAGGSKKFINDFKLRLPSEEDKKNFRKFVGAIAKNFNELEFFGSGDPEKIAKDLNSSLERVKNGEKPHPHTQFELQSYRSYFPEELTYKNQASFNSLNRDSQSILTNCAVILSAVNAINQAKQNSTQISGPKDPKIYPEILKPLIEYSKREKGLHKTNHSWTFNSIFNKPRPEVSLGCATLNLIAVISSFSYLASHNKLDHRILSIPFALGELICGLTGYYLKNKNYSTSLSKLMRNQAGLMATSTLICLGQIPFKGDIKQNEENILISDSVLMAHYINLALSSALIAPKNQIKDFYEKVDEKLDEKLGRVMHKIRASFLPSLKLPTREDELFWSKFLSKDTERNEKIDSSQQSPKLSPRNPQTQVAKKLEEFHEIQPAR
jgi:hypothetical protein